MAFRTFKFLLGCTSTPDTHEFVVEADVFPQAAAKAYVEVHKMRTDRNEWRIVSATDETHKIGEN